MFETFLYFSIEVEAVVSYVYVLCQLKLSASVDYIYLKATDIYRYCIFWSECNTNSNNIYTHVLAYSRLEPEASLESTPLSKPPPADWPKTGHIEMNDVCYRHSSDDHVVLKGISQNIYTSW